MFSLPPGTRHIPKLIDEQAQQALVDTIRNVVEQAPLYTPAMPKTGKEMSVRMTNCGPLGWLTDKAHGYRYVDRHPQTGNPWPPIPDQLLEIWNTFAETDKRPEACLINFYGADAKMGLHQDCDEKVFDSPVISISLGDDCLFRIGGTKRTDKTQSFRLCSGDIVILGGPSRLAFHGVDRLYPQTSTLLKNGGRINLTLRRVNP